MRSFCTDLNQIIWNKWNFVECNFHPNPVFTCIYSINPTCDWDKIWIKLYLNGNFSLVLLCQFGLSNVINFVISHEKSNVRVKNWHASNKECRRKKRCRFIPVNLRLDYNSIYFEISSIVGIYSICPCKKYTCFVMASFSCALF